eukprot:SAG11_NODE_5859_length_1443_cov_1.469191_3_plen_20_part_01
MGLLGPQHALNMIAAGVIAA